MNMLVYHVYMTETVLNDIYKRLFRLCSFIAIASLCNMANISWGGTKLARYQVPEGPSLLLFKGPGNQ